MQRGIPEVFKFPGKKRTFFRGTAVAPHRNCAANLEHWGLLFFHMISGMFFATLLRAHTQDRYHCGGGCNCWLLD
jgi:hypothetical protein